jgi:hypothetical protein
LYSSGGVTGRAGILDLMRIKFRKLNLLTRDISYQNVYSSSNLCTWYNEVRQGSNQAISSLDNEKFHFSF